MPAPASTVDEASRRRNDGGRSQSSDHDGYDYKEDYYKGVGGNDYVVNLVVA